MDSFTPTLRRPFVKAMLSCGNKADSRCTRHPRLAGSRRVVLPQSSSTHSCWSGLVCNQNVHRAARVADR